MRMVVHDTFGGPEVLRLVSADVPVARGEQVMVRIKAISVNGFDVGSRSGALKMITGRTFPKRTGLDFTGKVVTVPTKSSPFKPGDQVWGVTPLHEAGSAAELICIAPTQLAHAPIGLDLVEAAALPVAGSTVITALRDMGRLRAGQSLLVRGAAGGVGSVAVQLGHALGAHVTGTAGAANLDFVHEIGADRALDYASTTPADLGPFDVILDTVGSDLGAWRRLLAPKGRMMAIVPDLDHPLASITYMAWSRVHGGRRVRFFNDKPDTKLLTDLASYVSQGAIRPIVDGVYPLAEIGDAHRAMEAGGRRGKQVIQVS